MVIGCVSLGGDLDLLAILDVVSDLGRLDGALSIGLAHLFGKVLEEVVAVSTLN